MVTTDAFHELQAIKGGKKPYAIARQDVQPMALSSLQLSRIDSFKPAGSARPFAVLIDADALAGAEQPIDDGHAARKGSPEGRGPCQRAAREMRQANPQITVHCRRLKPGDGITFPATPL